VKGWYVVTVGKQVGIFADWFVHLSISNYFFSLMVFRMTVSPLVLSVSGAVHKKFATRAEAEAVFTAALNSNNVRVIR
jgi:cadmium resistance protein CadD (predicted permease)